MARLSLSVLGALEVRLHNEVVTAFESNKVRALLIYLTVEADRPHRREALAGLLWPERPERAARDNLRHALSTLRAAIGDRDANPPHLLVSRETVQFNCASDHWLDIRAFEGLEGADVASESAIRRVEHAVGLYRGHFLEGFSLRDSSAFGDWSLLVRERLQRQVLSALLLLSAAYERRGDLEQACACARRRIALEPWLEEAHRHLMRLLALSGQRSAALAQYDTCCHMLRQELGVDPAPETTALYERIRDGEVTGKGQERAKLNNLPAFLTPFVGRVALLDALRRLLQNPECRLVTVVGPGGCGKTRLALEAAAGQLDRYEHGVFFVSLAPLSSVAGIVPVVAQAVGLSFHGEVEPKQQLLRYLRRKNMLLVLDNYEHFVIGHWQGPGARGAANGTGIVVEILGAAPKVQIVITSRTKLNVPGEHVLPVGGMEVPRDGGGSQAIQFSAIALFVQSARRVQPSFVLTADNLHAVTRICQLVDGMPLGILLAAAWARTLHPAEIAAQIEHSLDFLTADWHAYPERQRSMRATFDHSWRLLTPQMQAILARFSVFRGGCDPSAAQSVANASTHQLRALVDASWLQPVSSPSHVPGSGQLCQAGARYEMHALVRQYVAEKLHRSPGRERMASAQHAAYYLAALAGWAEDLKGHRQLVALREIEADLENARTAWEWAVAQRDVAIIAPAMDGLCLYHMQRKRLLEGLAACQLLAKALKHGKVSPGGPRQVLARAAAWQSAFNRMLGQTEGAHAMLAFSRELLQAEAQAGRDVCAERAFLLLQMGDMLLETDCGKARDAYAHSVELYQLQGDRWWTAQALARQGYACQYLSEYAKAREATESSVSIVRSLGDRMSLAVVYRRLSTIAGSEGRLEEGESLARKALAVYREVGVRPAVADGLQTLAVIQLWSGRFGEACASFEQAAAIHEEQGDLHQYAAALHVLGWTRTNLGLYDQARKVVESAHALFQALDEHASYGWGFLGLGCIALAHGACEQARRLLVEGIDIFRDTGMVKGVGLCLSTLAHAERGLGRVSQAREHLHEALQIAVITRAFEVAYGALLGFALLLVDSGETTRAIELYALAVEHPYIGNSRYRADIDGRHISASGETLPRDVVAAAEQRGRARDLWATVEELLAEVDATM
jgi:predicted ATPase